uniref:Uncharacterized protein MANES_18G007700 n=1 Tax=Rhizophora mucronata TaxID=61149 RepID=A0A2P2KUV6_RHIMU
MRILLNHLRHCCTGYLVITILFIQILCLLKLRDSHVQYCMGCARWDLQLGQ